VPVQGAAGLREVHVDEAPAVRSAIRDHRVIDRGGHVPEEPLDGSTIRDVEGRGAQRAELARGALQVLGIPAGEDRIGPLGARRAVSSPIPALPPITTSVRPRSSGTRRPGEAVVPGLMIPPRVGSVRPTPAPACFRTDRNPPSRPSPRLFAAPRCQCANRDGTAATRRAGRAALLHSRPAEEPVAVVDPVDTQAVERARPCGLRSVRGGGGGPSLRPPCPVPTSAHSDVNHRGRAGAHTARGRRQRGFGRPPRRVGCCRCQMQVGTAAS
jgi:hypothetical protein